MARPRKNDRHLPPCVYQRHGAYWHVRSGKWTRLGEILESALIEYARIHEAPRGGMPDLIDTVGPRLQVIMDLLIRTGQRVTDVLRIRRTDLTDEGIRFVQQKTGAKLVLPWTPELRTVVDRAKMLHGNIRALTLLHNRKGKTPDYRTVHLQWVKACAAANVTDAHIHDLRAVALTAARRQGLNATRLAGQSSPAQTERYLRDREEPLAEGPSFGQSNRQD